MHPQQLKKKASRPISSSVTNRLPRDPTSYLKTRIRGSRLRNAARILVLIELTQRLHQAYRQAYDKQAADRLLPQNPRADLPDYVKNFYKTHQGTIDRCVNRVFGQKGDGTPDPAARIMERQTLRNAPEISYEMSQFQLQGNTDVPDTLATFGIPSRLGHGTVYIANDVPVSTTDIVKAVFHELGNILSAKMSYKLTGRADPYAYGDPNGVPYPTASGPPFYDKDTGARLERCVFGPPK